MAGDGTFTQLSQSFEEIGREFARLEAEHSAGETLIASAEYELEQIRKVLAGGVPDNVEPLAEPEAEAALPLPAVVEPEPPPAPASLVAKLRTRLAREVSAHLPVLRLSA